MIAYNDGLGEFKTYLKNKEFSPRTINCIICYTKKIIEKNLSEEDIGQFSNRYMRKQLRYSLKKLREFEEIKTLGRYKNGQRGVFKVYERI